MNKFAKLFLATAFIFASSSLFAGEVNEDEIKSVSDQTIVFENYTGPHQKIDTLDQIKAIGSGIAEGFNKDKAGNYGKDSRYYVIHSVSDENSGKLDADIFIRHMVMHTMMHIQLQHSLLFTMQFIVEN